jgi:biofilm protein TabA
VIVDRIDNWSASLSGPVWARAFRFLAALEPDSPEGDTALDGERMFGRVMAYETRGPNEGILETHRKFIDVQATLLGVEGIDWFPRATLEVKEPYDAVRDVELYHRPQAVPARVDVYPGYFAVFFPTDAHMAQQIVGGKREHIRKAVVKIHVDLVQGVHS